MLISDLTHMKTQFSSDFSSDPSQTFILIVIGSSRRRSECDFFRSQALPAFKLLHQVFLSLWRRDFPAVYAALQAPWPPTLKSSMDDLRSLTVLRATNILAKTYQNVAVEDFCSFLGVNPPDVEQGTEKGSVHFSRVSESSNVPD